MTSSTTAAKTSLSENGPKQTIKPQSIRAYSGLAHPPHFDQLPSQKQLVKVEPLQIEVEDGPDGFVAGFLHPPPDVTAPAPAQTHHKTAAILLSEAGGGVVGPSSMYLSIADKLASLSSGIPTLRLDYRYPSRNRYCVRDVLAAMDLLEQIHALNRFVLVGWSYGGAPVFTVGGNDARVVGCATVASQIADTEGVRSLAPRPLLPLHGTADRTLSPSCSERLYAMYGNKGDRKFHLFEGDDHALSRSAKMAEEMLCEFIVERAGLKVGDAEKREIMTKELVSDGERIDIMRKAGDLRSPESLE